MTRPYKVRWWRLAMSGYVRSRRKVRRADFAVAHLRQEAARARMDKNRDLGRYLEAVADLIEKAP